MQFGVGNTPGNRDGTGYMLKADDCFIIEIRKSSSTYEGVQIGGSSTGFYSGASRIKSSLKSGADGTGLLGSY